MKAKQIKKFIYGLLARLISSIFPVRKRLWIFGSDVGNMYREGSKYLLEYMIAHHPEYNCYFITQSKDVYEELRGKKIPCAMNLSIKGVWLAIRAECVFTTQTAADILFAFKKPKRHYYYLVHGQPYKVAIVALSKTDYGKKAVFNDTTKFKKIVKAIKAWLYSGLVCDTTCLDSEFVSATSEFLSGLQKLDFGEGMPSKILGMPRNDALFQSERMCKEKWIKEAEGKFVITYMPTHRLYGKGAFSPAPFANRSDVQGWMRDNNVMLLVKNHPTMMLYKKGYQPYESDCIRDISALGIDPMTAIYHSDVLITDYSSVWMDYLLLKRPLLFYIYDDFVHDDVGVYYDLSKESVGEFCYSEDDLFAALRKAKDNYSDMCPSDEVVRKFHKYQDGKSCERYYNEIANEL